MTDIDEKSSLIDVAFVVCSALDASGLRAVLTGGSAATFYAPDAYRSHDADFILSFSPSKRQVDLAMAGVGFEPNGSGSYVHPRTVFTVEFPSGPLMIGSRLIESWRTVHLGPSVLHVLHAEDSVRDRFMGYFAWSDFASLIAAVDVAAAQPIFDVDAFERWAKEEAASDPLYDVGRIAMFTSELEARRRP